MIVVVEGVSAAGKTAWCTHNASAIVPELGPLIPPKGDAAKVAQFWTDAHCGRWREAIHIEEERGTVYCDTDPLKLHYPWCLWQAGHGSREEWLAAVTATRVAILARTMGFADLVLFLEPETAVVRRQKENDRFRRRRNFERHLQLGAGLRKWYEIIDRLSPNRILWHGERVKELAQAPAKPDRFSVELFDEVVAAADRVLQ